MQDETNNNLLENGGPLPVGGESAAVPAVSHLESATHAEADSKLEVMSHAGAMSHTEAMSTTAAVMENVTPASANANFSDISVEDVHAADTPAASEQLGGEPAGNELPASGTVNGQSSTSDGDSARVTASDLISAESSTSELSDTQSTTTKSTTTESSAAREEDRPREKVAAAAGDSSQESALEPATIVVPTVKHRRTKSAAEYQQAMTAQEQAPAQMHWYILKVATNREDSVCDTLRRKIAMAGLERYFGEIVVPIELITEFRNGKKRTTKRKLYPGYIVVHMEINDDTWYIVRETSGIGDFTGAMGRPTPMSAADIAKILPKSEDGPAEQPKVAIKYKPGDKVRIKEGNFINFEGAIEAIDEAKGRVTVMVNIFGRPTPVDIEYWLVEKVD